MSHLAGPSPSRHAFYSGPFAPPFDGGAAPGQQLVQQHSQHQQQQAFPDDPGWWKDGVNLASSAQHRAMQQQQHQHQPYGGSFHHQPNDYTSSELTGRQTHSSSSTGQPYSPNAAYQQYPPHSKTASPPAHFTMAAAPMSQSPTTVQHQQQQPHPQPQHPQFSNSTNTAVATPPTPQSPSMSGAPNTTRDQARISLLLEINQELLTEIQRLQTSDQGGALSSTQAAQLKQAGQADKMASEDYIQLLRRLQGNFAYMMPRAGQATNNNGDGGRFIPGPAFMQHPPQMPQLADKYARLRELFPEWPGNDAKLMAMSVAGAGSPAHGGNGNQQQQQQQQPPPQQQYNANGAVV